ncbi:hypothetical protein [Dethiothermospora halolimnae]|uniref:hypothetical protein n=1 Tax=Dethiothermospora halolimnae TaxID=3114390 RepID=UPI003CCC40D7
MTENSNDVVIGKKVFKNSRKYVSKNKENKEKEDLKENILLTRDKKEISTQSILIDDCCCEESKSINLDPCVDFSRTNLTINRLNCQSTLIRVMVTIRNVCENRFLGIGVVLTDPDIFDIIYAQKSDIIFTGKFSGSCGTVRKEFCFIIPGDICNPLNLKANAIAHYVGTNPVGRLECEADCGGLEENIEES